MRELNFSVPSIAIVGYGYVGKAVHHGFSKVADVLIVDPKYNDVSVTEVCKQRPRAIFLCVPTPTGSDGHQDLSIIWSVMKEIREADYAGIVVIKSTVLPQELEALNAFREVVYNPEFLSHRTANEDFVHPQMVVLAGHRAEEVLELYRSYSTVDLDKVFITDLRTASLVKYAMNTFYAVKLIFMNQLKEIAEVQEVDWESLTSILREHSWMGDGHYQVPGSDGQHGFGGQCLPKDARAFVHFAKEFSADFTLLEHALEVNEKLRKH